MKAAPPLRSLTVHFLRHSQALHNVRAEPLRAAGCTFSEFLAAMKADDALDAPLTAKGVEDTRKLAASLRATAHPALECTLLVASPLSRALRTADLALPPAACGAKRIAQPLWREISGLLLNAKHRPRAALEREFPGWDFAAVAEDDEGFDLAELEGREACGARAVAGLEWIFSLPPALTAGGVAVACHGGILSYMAESGRVEVEGWGKFGNCEMRTCTVTETGGGFEIEVKESA
ncbi:hypothetical protein TeGR_g5607 [Tetraparma gracilis]|uniref:Phosphoglycerate mutase-like protein n=1 Tax=Tetraparma gracilis TaxID=2962635 RepID=A0ABQ6MHH5_9STRA|nr:hypothetical protein TeGR_g5607 [Tetraparma gracilis]